jgi:DNA-binding MarR family transcriptional regulator
MTMARSDANRGGVDAQGRGSRTARLANAEERILSSLRRIIRAVDLHSRELARTYGLTAPQLICLRELDRRGPLLSGQLARDVSLSPATVTGILDRLERRDLVLRERRPEDKRQILLRLTDEGRRVAREAPAPLQERFRRRLASLPAAKRQAIEQALRIVVEMMEASDIDAAPLLTSGPTTADSSLIETLLGNEGEQRGQRRRARRRRS